jgi:hypothetical protein
VNYSADLKKKCKPAFIYYTFVDELNDHNFLNGYLGGFSVEFSEEDINILNSGFIRDCDGSISRVIKRSAEFDIRLLTSEMKIYKKDNIERVVTVEEYNRLSSEETVSSSTHVEERTKKQDLNQHELETLNYICTLNQAIEKLNREMVLSESTINKLRTKYTTDLMNKGLSLKILFSSFIKESELALIEAGIKGQKLTFTVDQQKHMFQYPEYFQLIQSVNKTGSNPIKDKRTRAEIDSIFNTLSNKIGTYNLTLSKKMQKVILINYKMWLTMVKHTRTKIENKKFLLNVFLTLSNNAIISDEDDKQDFMWQEIINKISEFITFEDSDDDDDELLKVLFSIEQRSRITYRASGYPDL